MSVSIEKVDLRAECARLAVKALSSRFDLMTPEEIAAGTEDLSDEIRSAIEWWLTWRYG